MRYEIFEFFVGERWTFSFELCYSRTFFTAPFFRQKKSQKSVSLKRTFSVLRQNKNVNDATSCCVDVDAAVNAAALLPVGVVIDVGVVVVVAASIKLVDLFALLLFFQPKICQCS